MTKNRKPWQRMALSLMGVTIVAAMWRWATFHLYSLPEHSIAGFVSITNNAHYVIGAVVIFMVTGRLVYDWKNQSQTVANVLSRSGGADPKDFDSPDIP